MTYRDLGGHRFDLVGPIAAERDGVGALIEYVHELPPGTKANPFGSEPFCRLTLASATDGAGVYAIEVGGDVKYVGECVNLRERFGDKGYGVISARNCHSDGQSTNCKINSRVLAALKQGELAQVWFHRCAARIAIEDQLKAALRPSWNSDRSTWRSMSRRIPELVLSAPDSAQFRRALERRFRAAASARVVTVEVRAGDLHREVGGYPGPRHRMPVCCAEMRAVMRAGDCIVQSPPRGAGASLVARYKIPRS